MSPSTRFSLRLFAYFALSFTPLMVLGNWAVARLIGGAPDPLTSEGTLSEHAPGDASLLAGAAR